MNWTTYTTHTDIERNRTDFKARTAYSSGALQINSQSSVLAREIKKQHNAYKWASVCVCVGVCVYVCESVCMLVSVYVSEFFLFFCVCPVWGCFCILAHSNEHEIVNPISSTYGNQ